VIVHSAQTIETRRAAFGTSVVTPAEQLYVRNNLPPPDASIVADRDGWQVAIEGVRTPRSFTVAELKTIGVETVATVLQCSGNGRGFFPSKPSGTPWTGRRRRAASSGAACRCAFSPRPAAASPRAWSSSPAPAARSFPTASTRCR
jgi:DMSO/TMAO reductase YedYZ molybdopterin-dependent catalytic subunit